MTKTDNESKLPHIFHESQLEDELSDELRMVMENEARAVSLNLIPRRAFLNRIVQISLPAGIVLASAEVASACWFCDENSGCQAGCLICKEGSGCQAGCMLCNTQVDLCDYSSGALVCPHEIQAR